MELKGARIRNFFNITAGSSDGDERLRFPQLIKIPHYQRPYKWNSENIEKLIDDWASDIGSDSKYFAGSIVTVDDERSEKRCHQLIDGQQRFTTIYLVNYIRFVLARVALRQACTEIGRAYVTKDITDTFRESISFLVLSSSSEETIEQYSNHVSELVGKVFKETSKPDSDPVHWRRALAKLLFLPELYEDNDDYLNNHHEQFKAFFGDKMLALDYDRSSFRSALTSALSRTVIFLSDQNYPSLQMAEEHQDATSHERKFGHAIECIFNKFSELVDESLSPFDHAVEMLKKMNDFLTSVSLCVVQTGNTRDAYTLFEVLNDRSLALDDLDLVKNLFYKKFVEANSSMTDKNIDDVVQQLDDQWVDQIFGDEGAQKTKLIAYLGVVFITGNTSTIYNKSEDFRSAVNEYLSSLDQYSPEKVRSHFNVFYAVKIILEVVGVRFKLKDLVAVKAEFDPSASFFKKTVLFLLARDQEGVLSGLVNYLLKYIQSESPDFRPTAVKEIVNRACSVGVEDIEKQSKSLWQASMMAQTAKEPREFSVKVIERFNYESSLSDLQPILLSHEEFSTLLVQFKRWLELWKYDDSKLRVRLLFARLLTLKPNNDESALIAPTVGFGVSSSNVQDLQLDHIEPRRPDDFNLNAYFEDQEREYHVDGLGNMMPLTASLNASRSNSPAKMAFKFYEEAGLNQGHHLMIMTKDLFDNHTEGGEDNQVPKVEFFQYRKEKLLKLFELAAKH